MSIDLSQIERALIQPLETTFRSFQEVLPGLAIGILVLIIGYFISSFLGFVVRKILYKINLDKRLRKEDLDDSLGHISIAKLFGTISKWSIFAVFLNQAVVFFELGVVSSALRTVISWLPNIIFAFVIIVVGLIFVDFVVHKILQLRSRYMHVIASLIKFILIFVVIFTALDQLGINIQFAQTIFLLFVGAVFLTLSLVVGIGLGFAVKDEAKGFLKFLRKRFR